MCDIVGNGDLTVRRAWNALPDETTTARIGKDDLLCFVAVSKPGFS